MGAHALSTIVIPKRDPLPVVLTLARIPHQSVEQDLCNLAFTVCKGGPALPALRKSQVSKQLAGQSGPQLLHI
ncbi:hypothetical protein GCM10009080_41980 [Cupriavidus pauculus]